MTKSELETDVLDARAAIKQLASNPRNGVVERALLTALLGIVGRLHKEVVRLTPKG